MRSFVSVNLYRLAYLMARFAVWIGGHDWDDFMHSWYNKIRAEKPDTGGE